MNARKLATVLGLAVVVVLCSLALSAQSPIDKFVIRPAPTPLPILPSFRIDIGGGGWTLVCPSNCNPVTSPPNTHGETQTFCDCDGDGMQDLACRVWIKTDADGDQSAICHPGCPGEGSPDGQVCAKHLVERPDGKDYISCACE